MAKRFGALDLVANTETILMTGATGFNTTANVRFVNRNATDVTVRLALVDAPAGTALASLSVEDYLEYDTVLLANQVLENTGLAIPDDYTLVVRADSTGVTVVAYGYEEVIV